jgi:hypothetical protein
MIKLNLKASRFLALPVAARDGRPIQVRLCASVAWSHVAPFQSANQIQMKISIDFAAFPATFRALL